MSKTADLVKEAMDRWFESHPEFGRGGWVLTDREPFQYERMVVRSPPGARLTSISLHTHSVSFFIDDVFIDLKYRYLRDPSDSHRDEDQARAVARVLRCLDYVAQGRVRLVKPLWRSAPPGTGAPGGGIYLRGRYGWHKARRVSPADRYGDSCPWVTAWFTWYRPILIPVLLATLSGIGSALVGEDVPTWFPWAAPPAVAGCLFLLVFPRTRVRETAPANCSRCGTSLRGMSGPRCPWCGKWLAVARRGLA